MQHIYMFYKNNFYYNIATTEGTDMYNLPQYNSSIILYKGIENKLQFSARNRDRKGISLGEKELFLTIINKDLNFKIVKKMSCEDEYKGLYNITFSEKEMRDFEETYYQGSVSAKLGETEDILYSGIEWEPTYNIIVKESYRDVFKNPIDVNINSMILSNYTDKDGIEYKKYISSIIKSNDSNSHTAIITLEKNFQGKIILEGSGENTPQPNDDNWFNIEEKEIQTSDLQENTNISFNKQLNCLWVRFKIIQKITEPNLNISKILYRN